MDDETKHDKRLEDDSFIGNMGIFLLVLFALVLLVLIFFMIKMCLRFKKV